MRSAILTMITPAIAEAIHTFNRSYPVTVNPPASMNNMIVINKQVAWLTVNVIFHHFFYSHASSPPFFLLRFVTFSTVILFFILLIVLIVSLMNPFCSLTLQYPSKYYNQKVPAEPFEVAPPVPVVVSQLPFRE